MRVAAVIATETISGPGRQLTAVAQRLRVHGVELHVILLQRHAHAAAFAGHLARHDVPCTCVTDRGPLDVGTLRRVRDVLEREGAELLQTHGYKPTAIGYALRRTSRRPWVAFFHGATDKNLKDRFYHALERRMLRAADGIVVVSAHQRGMFNGSSARVRVVHNAIVPLADAAAADTHDLATLRAGGRPLIGVIGRLSAEKGVDVFLRACAQLRTQGVELAAVIAGDGPERPQLDRLAGQLGVSSDVRFLGHVGSPAALYRQLDLLVLPSRSEGLPNVLLEALAADVPVVATAVGAVPDVLRDARAGVTVPADDPQALAAGIAQGLQRIGAPDSAAARSAVVREFSLENRVDQHLALYRELMELHA